MALLGVAAVAGFAYAFLASPTDLVFRYTDDAYYYFNVARNLALGHGPTFDRLNATNGFHPLWMLCLMPVFALSADQPLLALRLVLCLITVITCATLWIVHRTLERFLGREAAGVGVAAMLSPVFLNPLVNGLETGLVVLLLWLLLWACHRHRLLDSGTSARADAALGALLGLLLLSRLDLIFAVGTLGALTGVRALRAGGARAAVAKLLRIGAPIVVLVAPYLAWNQARFGHLVPISGMLKSTFPVVSFSAHELRRMDVVIGETQLLIATAGIAISLFLPRLTISGATLWSRAEATSGWLAAIALWLGACLHFANSILFMNWGVYWWHFASYGPTALLALALIVHGLLDRLGRRRLWAAAAISAMVALSLFTHRVETRIRGNQHRIWHQSALWARDHLPLEAVIGMTDCGTFGYFSERRTINLDGVINSYAYHEAVRERRLTAFLQKCGVTHFAHHAVVYREGVYVVPITTHVLGLDDAVVVTTPAAEVYRSPPYQDGHVVIWDARRVRVLNDVADLAPLRR
ncbi:MAG TPA: hypothetical protein VEY91_08600 [Candidatus Limnocylindria bacterium]|nr:hypothetical protein [Candidatus Limnocylindria bacterium]